MRMSLIFLIIGVSLSAGCASQPPENPWSGVTTEVGSAVASLDCGTFPYPSDLRDTTGDGKIDTAVYDEVGVNELEAYRICAEANEANVDEHALQIMQLKVARRALVDAGKAQRNIANMRAEMLEDERRHNFWQSIGYWVAILGMGLAL